mmetsp:Transcript_8622/g.21606  ORF Transcript_8622/g.21606 Transcript_8622/m.21606 type:complete len:130 (-) Transcript_8622:230-619(-)|eukprot:CAMPEP_0113498084 /NCGR_PEP_ID=MMETSP0014_2-20120614/30965_1 /TAXON_ID=2857 /ORGANISM="Nitzschia sp." /LENGTH=129 /DNA_ID=CAMNT_0000392047 /DNA_START=58 /DNA_END=447 /DNA_ORIENTATION=+ /assembly_acc=CAM_ASM_000159
MNHQQPLDLDYPNLASCKIKLVGGSAATSRPPVQLPRTVRISAAEAAASGGGDDGTYDFSLEHSILKRKQEREQEQILHKATSRDELQSATVNKMKTVTGADEDVCVAILNDHSFDLKQSVETFFLQTK